MITEESILSSFGIGLFCVLIYAWVVYAIPIRKYLTKWGLATNTIILVAVLFLFGYEKHLIEYYSLVAIGYCKSRETCATPPFPSLENLSFSLMKDYFSYAKNLWLNAAGEGVVFVLLGLPIFYIVSNGYLAAFLTGLAAHILTAWFGFNSDICAETCVPINGNTVDSGLQ